MKKEILEINGQKIVSIINGQKTTGYIYKWTLFTGMGVLLATSNTFRQCATALGNAEFVLGENRVNDATIRHNKW